MYLNYVLKTILTLFLFICSKENNKLNIHCALSWLVINIAIIVLTFHIRLKNIERNKYNGFEKDKYVLLLWTDKWSLLLYIALHYNISIYWMISNSLSSQSKNRLCLGTVILT